MCTDMRVMGYQPISYGIPLDLLSDSFENNSINKGNIEKCITDSEYCSEGA